MKDIYHRLKSSIRIDAIAIVIISITISVVCLMKMIDARHERVILEFENWELKRQNNTLIEENIELCVELMDSYGLPADHCLYGGAR